jgi:hypothetical protein
MRIAPPVVLSTSQAETLRQWAGSRSLPARQVERAKIVLLAAAGRTDVKGGVKRSHGGGVKGDHFSGNPPADFSSVLGAVGTEPCEAGRPSV